MDQPQHTSNDRSRDLFQQALELPPAEQTEYLAAACGSDEALRGHLLQLLQAHRAANAMFDEQPQCGEAPGDRIGRYKLLQRIGEGGFGIVWMAEQEEPVRRKVALKVLKAGMDTSQVVARFEAERQALALMDHTNIAKVFDGGATPQGRPYFVMELVRGIPITRYCDEASLPMGQRLELFVQVCHAVQHAHQKGVIHRDLKPSNVLVTLHDGKPVPKVIDFGIAKSTQGSLTDRTMFTEFRQMLGTPDYMAPEQAELSGLDVDTRADVYSLGVLLYELLTGTPPFEMKSLLQAGYAAMLHTIKEVDPPRPSTRVSTLGEQMLDIARHRKTHPKFLSAAIRGDLDRIVMMAMEKERDRRYATATAFADDVLRHLRHEPVLAGSPGRVYRLRKYVRRHRVGVAAGAAIAASLAIGTAVSAAGYWEATEQAQQARAAEQRAATAFLAEKREKELAVEARAEADREATKAKSVVKLLESMLSASDPHEQKGRNYPVRMLLADFERSLDQQGAQDPDVEATLRGVLASSYLGLGMAASAEPHVARALQLRRQQFGEQHWNVALAHEREARLRHDQGRFAEALAALDLAEAALPGEDPDKAALVGQLQILRADYLRHAGKLDEAERVARGVLSGAELLASEAQRGMAMTNLSLILKAKGDLIGAEDLATRTLELQKGLHAEAHPDVATALVNLACVRHDRGDLPGAETGNRRALELRRELYGDEHPQVANSLNNLALVRSSRGDAQGAADLLRRALGIQRELLGDRHHEVATTLNNLAMILRDLGTPQESEGMLREALDIEEEVYGEGHRTMATTLGNLAVLLQDRGAFADAEAMFRRVLEVRERTDPEGGPGVVSVLNNLGLLLVELGRPAEAEELYGRALAMIEKAHGKEHPDLAPLLSNLAGLAKHRGRLDEAEQAARRALAIRKRWTGGESLDVAAILGQLAGIALGRGDLPQAEELARRSLEIRVARVGERNLGVAGMRGLLAQVLEARGRLAEAETEMRRALELDQALGAQVPALSARLNNLATILMLGGGLVEAEGLLRESLELRRKHVGGRHLDIAISMANLANVLLRRGDLAGAEDLGRQALALKREILGATHAEVATSLHLLGSVRWHREDLAGAEVLFRQALEMRRELFVADHPHIADSLGMLAGVRRAQRELADAEQLCREALAMRRRLFVEPHPDIAASLQSLAEIQHRQRELVAAEESCRGAVAMLEELVGDDHGQLAAPLHCLSRILRDRGSLAAARETLRRELSILRSSVGGEHPHVATALCDLATIESEIGDAAEAERLHREALAMRRKLFGNADPWVANSMIGLASCLLRAGRFADAEAEARAVLAQEHTGDNGQRRRGEATACVGMALLGRGLEGEAEPLLVQACSEITPRDNGRNDVLRDALTALIGLLERQSKSESAEPLRERLRSLDAQGR